MNSNNKVLEEQSTDERIIKILQEVVRKAKVSLPKLKEDFEWTAPPRVMTSPNDAAENIGENWESKLDMALIEEAREIRRRLIEEGKMQNAYTNWQWKNANWKGIEYIVEERYDKAIETLIEAAEIVKNSREASITMCNLTVPYIRLEQFGYADEISELSLKAEKLRCQLSSESISGTLQSVFYNRLETLLIPDDDSREAERRLELADKLALEMAVVFRDELQDPESFIAKYFFGAADPEIIEFQKRKSWKTIQELLDLAQLKSLKH